MIALTTKKIFLFTAVLSIQLSFAQFAKVADPDGDVNVRESADANSTIAGKINSGEIVYTFPDERNKTWLNVDYNNKKGENTAGYIHRSRLKLIESYEAVPSVSKDKNKAIFQSGPIQVEITAGKFNYKENKKFFSSSDYSGQKIEDQYKGQQVWGTDGTIPETHYKSITVHIGHRIIQVPRKEIESLFNINNESAQCYYDLNNDILYITMTNSDGAGSYVVLFEIEKGGYKGRKVMIPF
ncbi:MAG: SH3 domain-containing protein [Chryseobacterium sp.]|uniref:SH3 domain-containing protein n=1 Tax=Chryseobacterium sp. TaxID=1871047 RepID=UPI0025C2CD9E|nr:SH3 domain-containing protein [Chryseobacterium sp.]MCJ7935107.1 SH3 domain-containing protein [Chryseobacterium sp.]